MAMRKVVAEREFFYNYVIRMRGLFDCKSRNRAVVFLLEVSSPFVRHKYNMLPVVLPLPFTNIFIFIVHTIHIVTSAAEYPVALDRSNAAAKNIFMEK
jgi:hypothetical protein